VLGRLHGLEARQRGRAAPTSPARLWRARLAVRAVLARGSLRAQDLVRLRLPRLAARGSTSPPIATRLPAATTLSIGRPRLSLSMPPHGAQGHARPTSDTGGEAHRPLLRVVMFFSCRPRSSRRDPDATRRCPRQGARSEQSGQVQKPRLRDCGCGERQACTAASHVQREWKVVGRCQWQVFEAMPVLEGRAALYGLHHLLRSQRNVESAPPYAGDPFITACAIAKGRSPSYARKRVKQQIASLSLAFGCSLDVRWVPSDWNRNVADSPSRGGWQPSATQDVNIGPQHAAPKHTAEGPQPWSPAGACSSYAVCRYPRSGTGRGPGGGRPPLCQHDYDDHYRYN